MAKNFFIFALIILCGVMLLTLSNKANKSGGSPIIAKIAKKMAKNKLAHPELIKIASVHGLSLSTPVEKIDSILANEPYKCRTNERENKDKEDKTYQEKFWTCSHTTYRGASLRVHVIDDEIKDIARTGPSSKKRIEEARAYLDVLKMKMESYKGLTMNQSETSTTFRINHKYEDGTTTSLSYRMQIIPVRDPENPPQNEGMLSVSLVR